MPSIEIDLRRRPLYAVSRDAKAKPNDADRLKKFLARFELDWETITR
jgi:transcriptional regulatory protein RtcR